jgi:hypothetical protein
MNSSKTKKLKATATVLAFTVGLPTLGCIHPLLGIAVIFLFVVGAFLYPLLPERGVKISNIEQSPIPSDNVAFTPSSCFTKPPLAPNAGAVLSLFFQYSSAASLYLSLISN